jgi:serine/threonine protein kinase
MLFYQKSAPELYGRVSKKVVHQTDAELKILKILREKIIKTGISPCILELIYSKVCEGVAAQAPNEEYCEKLAIEHEHDKRSPSVKVYKSLCRYADMIAGGLAHDKYAFAVLERCDISLGEYLKREISAPINISIIESILFQIVYTIHAIKTVYPSFHHYDLHTENVMLKFDTDYKFSAENQRFLVFKIRKTKQRFVIPYFGIIVKIIDFGFSVILEEKVVSDAVLDRVSMFNRSENDLLFLFHWIHHTVKKNGTDNEGAVFDMLMALDPSGMFITYNTSRIREIAAQIATYEDMLNSPVFEKYASAAVSAAQIHRVYRL